MDSDVLNIAIANNDFELVKALIEKVEIDHDTHIAIMKCQDFDIIDLVEDFNI